MLRALLLGSLVAATVVAAPASATQFVTNGNFSATTATGSRQMSAGGTQYVTGWTNDNDGYNFIVTGDPTVTPNSSSQSGMLTNNYGYIALWGKNNAGTDSVAATNGLSESVAAHGNFLAADGAFGVSKIYQLITGLTVGQVYDVSFDWAGAQQYSYNGDTTEGWGVSLSTTLANASYQTTGNIANVSHGFTGWRTTTFSFTATASSEYLTFLANGTPTGTPPFSLLDNVSMTERAAGAVPEPATWAMMLIGFGAIGGLLRRRRPAFGLA